MRGHGGEITLGDSVLGGLKAVIRVPVTPADEKPGPLTGAEQGQPREDI